MKLKDLENQQRQYEISQKHEIPPNNWIVSMLDGRSFTKLTQRLQYEKPFSDVFKNIMTGTVKTILDSGGFNIIYGYSQSDEISLLHALNENTFNRRTDKFYSVLAALTTSYWSCFTEHYNLAFDCKLFVYPTYLQVIDHFRWRMSDAERNSLNSFCYYTLLDSGISPTRAQKIMSGLSVSDKHEILYKYNRNWNNLETWKKRGFGIYFTRLLRQGYNPVEKIEVEAVRKQLVVNDDLPIGVPYQGFISNIIHDQ